MSTKRIKDAGFLQQHFEKLVLAAGLLVFVLAFYLFVISKPFAVQVQRKTYPDPKEAVDVLVRIDEQINSGLQDPEPLPTPKIPEFSANVRAMMQPPVDLDKRVADLGDSGLTLRDIYPIPPDVSPYALVYPPPPKEITYKVGTDVLDKEFIPELAKQFFVLWNKDWQEPGDFTMFVAAGEFDIWEWVTRLQADPTREGEIKIPIGIWTQRLGIAGVGLLRETWDPEKGEWTDRQIVVPLPGQIRTMPGDMSTSETTQALNLLAELRDRQLELAQPELPTLTGFVQVAPPGVEDEGKADEFLLGASRENLGPAELKILKLEERIKLLEERRAAREERRGGNPRPGAADGDRPQPERRDRIAAEIESLRDKITRLQPQAQKDAENRKKLAERERLLDEDRKRRLALQSDPGEGPGIEGLNLQEGASLRIWAADPSMQPGKTYQYKLIVSVINPLYAVPRLAKDQLQENLHRAAIMPTEAEIEEMDWIGPITVEPKSRFFFTSGRGKKAKVDIFRRFDGELRLQEFDGGPGDVIGTAQEFEGQLGQPINIDMSVGSIILDIETRRDLLSNTTVTTLIYADKDGNIFERTDLSDKNSPDRKSSRDEIKDGPKGTLRPAEDADPSNRNVPDDFAVDEGF